MLYSDLDKKSRGGFIVEDTLVMNEVFDTAINVKKGQIFYGRQFGYDFEQYLLRLNESSTLLNLQDELYHLRNVDGRLLVDPSKTDLYTDDENPQTVLIQTMLNIQGLAQIPVSSTMSDENDTFITIQEYTEMKNQSQESTNNSTIDTLSTLSLDDGRNLKIKNGKIQGID